MVPACRQAGIAAVLPAYGGSAEGGKTVGEAMPCVYVLRSVSASRFYVGSSREDNSRIRLRAHNAGKVRSTKFGKPWIVVHEERFTNYTQAIKREIELKSGQGREWIKERWQSGLLRQS